LEETLAHHLPLEITREDDLWMVRSPAIQGLWITGETLERVLGELPAVAQALFEVCQEKGWSFVTNQPDLKLSDIVWVFELPHPLLQAA
jgi:predicted RNase H-like HicB family nuclease